jgi:hypothetical protein
VQQAADVGEEVVLRRDHALVDLLARDERVAVLPLVGEQAAEQEQPFGGSAAAAGGGVEAGDRAPAGDSTSLGLMMSGSVTDSASLEDVQPESGSAAAVARVSSARRIGAGAW